MAGHSGGVGLSLEERRSFVERLRATVRPEQGWLPAFIHVDPQVYALEAERIFGACWLFVAHDSEVPSAGDYLTRSMGEDPIIVARGEDGAVRVFLNFCRHRGMRICRSELGNASHFRCPYHGFTYRNTGKLVGVPFQQEAYGEELDKDQLSLVQAKTETYEGLIFATWDQQAEPLGDYLGDMKWYLDLLFKRARMKVVGHPQNRVSMTNWKLPAENFASDAYHTAHSHASIAQIGLAARTASNTSSRPDFSKYGYQVSAGNGHGLGLGMPSTSPVLPDELLPIYEQNLSPAQFSVIKQLYNIHALVFPNMSMQISPIYYNGRVISHTSINVYQPKGPGTIETSSWFLVEDEAPSWWKDISRQMYLLTFSPSGMFEQDDVENFTDVFATIKGPAGRATLLNYQMGLTRPVERAFVGPGEVYQGKYCEANARAFYRRWLDLITTDSVAGRG
jgi:phenylpropionate dioxygenase-like ring-hydroxylating dioxygenase large terminal subunit